MNTTLHIPVNKAVKEQAEAVVREQGYSSLQEVLRVLIFSLAKREVRTTLINTSTVHLTPKQERHLNRREKETRQSIKTGKAYKVHSVDEMMGILEKAHNPLLRNHELKGEMSSKKAFSVDDNCRVIFIEDEDKLLFLDIGTHDQVYQ